MQIANLTWTKSCDSKFSYHYTSMAEYERKLGPFNFKWTHGPVKGRYHLTIRRFSISKRYLPFVSDSSLEQNFKENNYFYVQELWGKVVQQQNINPSIIFFRLSFHCCSTLKKVFENCDQTLTTQDKIVADFRCFIAAARKNWNFFIENVMLIGPPRVDFLASSPYHILISPTTFSSHNSFWFQYRFWWKFELQKTPTLNEKFFDKPIH